MKTLYVSDLNGTLLNSSQTLSDFTVNTLNTLVDRGMIFSYATAFSFVTTSNVTSALSSRIPAIIYNGAFVVDRESNKKLISNIFTESEGKKILDVLLQHKVYPIVFSHIDGIEKFSYIEELESKGMKMFNDTRRRDVRNNPVNSLAELYEGEIFCFSCIDEPERLFPLYDFLKDRFSCFYYRDICSGEQRLDINPTKATKANAILELKQLLGCDRIVTFGNCKNDIAMFDISDECYAVDNADDEMKAKATATIESSDKDGVAKWLKENFR